MDLTRKSDVENRLSTRWWGGLHPYLPAREPGTSGFSAAEPGGVVTNPRDSVEDFPAKHRYSGIFGPQAVHFDQSDYHFDQSDDHRVQAAPRRPARVMPHSVQSSR